MIASALSLLGVLSAVGGTSSPSPGAPVSYTLAPVMTGDSLAALAVEIGLDGDADGETRLDLPQEWAGTDSLWKQLSAVEVEGAASVREDGPAVRVIAHRPGAPLVVRYRVTSPYGEAPGFGYEKAVPLIRPGWFFFHGEGVFATPEGREKAPARFTWRGFPEGWTLASDLDHLGGARPGTVTDVVESAAIGGADVTVVQRDVGGAPLRVATRGRWGFTPEAFADAVGRIVEAENALWGDAGRPFLVPLAPLGEVSGHSYNGTGRSDAFSVVATNNFALDEASRFLAHEYMHTWIAREVGGFPEKEQARGYWFSEGFSDFYAARVLLRAGLWTPEEYVDELNRVLFRYASSPARGATGTDVVARFWTDQAVHQLPYDRGHLLALVFDHRIRQPTGGLADLDDVLLAQRALARRDSAATGAAALFPTVVRAEYGIDLAPDLARHEGRGEPVTLPADLFGTCARVETATQPEFHRGFDIERTQAAGGVITGVDPASPAYAAGLRDGMKLVRRESGTIGDASVEIVYRVDDGGTERLIRYMPEGKGRITFQRVVLAPDEAHERCAQVMSGA